MGKDIAIVANKKLVLGFGRKERAVPAHAHNHSAQCGKEIRQLAQRRVDDRAFFLNGDAHQMRFAVHKAFGVKSGRCAKPLQRGGGHFPLGADDHIDGHVVAAVKIAVNAFQIALGA